MAKDTNALTRRQIKKQHKLDGTYTVEVEMDERDLRAGRPAVYKTRDGDFEFAVSDGTPRLGMAQTITPPPASYAEARRDAYPQPGTAVANGNLTRSLQEIEAESELVKIRMEADRARMEADGALAAKLQAEKELTRLRIEEFKLLKEKEEREIELQRSLAAAALAQKDTPDDSKGVTPPPEPAAPSDGATTSPPPKSGKAKVTKKPTAAEALGAGGVVTDIEPVTSIGDYGLPDNMGRALGLVKKIGTPEEYSETEVFIAQLLNDLAHAEKELTTTTKKLETYAQKFDQLSAKLQDSEKSEEMIVKRYKEEVNQASKAGGAKFAKNLLPTVDQLLRIIETSNPDNEAVKAYVQGFKMYGKLIEDSLESSGVQIIKLQPGDAFDPSTCEAVGSEASTTVKKGDVCKVYRNAYKLGDTVIVYGQVVVAS